MTIMPELDETEKPEKRRSHGWKLFVVLLLFLVTVGLIVTNEFFPEHTETSCTVEDPGHNSYRLRFLSPELRTDCGRFRSANQVTCTSNPEREVHLSIGTTYDLVVRGPNIPRVSAPKVISATVSAEQRHEINPGMTEVDPTAAPGVPTLQGAARPETLRAFDYEQPPFDAHCDPTRVIMTTAGLQLTTPGHAELLLTPPAVVTPRDPLLPCEGYQCGR